MGISVLVAELRFWSCLLLVVALEVVGLEVVVSERFGLEMAGLVVNV